MENTNLAIQNAKAAITRIIFGLQRQPWKKKLKFQDRWLEKNCGIFIFNQAYDSSAA